MNRATRRAGQRGKGLLANLVCEHGNVMKTDGTGTPECPHGCGFNSPATYSPREELQVSNAYSGAETIDSANDISPWSCLGEPTLSVDVQPTA